MQFGFEEEEPLLELHVPYQFPNGQTYGQYLADRVANVRSKQADKDRHASQALFHEMLQELDAAAFEGKNSVKFKYRAISNLETGLSPLIHKSLAKHEIRYSMVQFPKASEEEQKAGEFGEGIIQLLLPQVWVSF